MNIFINWMKDMQKLRKDYYLFLHNLLNQLQLNLNTGNLINLRENYKFKLFNKQLMNLCL